MPAPGSTPPNFGPRKPKIEVRRAEDLTGRPVIKSNPIHRATMKFVAKKLLPFLVNWKTTLIGIGLVGGGVAGIAEHLAGVADGKPLTLEAVQVHLAAIAGGVAAIFARDANKSSQDSTIRK